MFAVFPHQFVGVGLVRWVLGHQGDADTQGAIVVVHLHGTNQVSRMCIITHLRISTTSLSPSDLHKSSVVKHGVVVIRLLYRGYN